MTTQQAQVKIEFGKCPFCEKAILKKDKENNPVRLEGYSEFWMALSDGSRMKVAICENCKKSLTKANAEAILAAHREFWTKGIEKTIDQKIEQLKKDKVQNVNYYSNLKLIKHGLKERDLD